MKMLMLTAGFLLSGLVQAKEVRIGFYGDSTAYGSAMAADGSYYRSANNEPDQLEWLLQTKYMNVVFVENRGAPGSICTDFLNGTGGVPQRWGDEMARSPVDIVIMNVGLNDAGRLTNTQFIDCYTELVRVAKSHGKRFVINAPNPVDKHFNFAYWGTVHAQEYVAAQEGAIVINHWQETMDQTPAWRTMLPDGVHPNDELYGLKAARTAAAIEWIVEQVLAE